jgi:hypothetical protein
MIISILNYALFAVLLIYGFRVRFRSAENLNTQLFFIIPLQQPLLLWD